MNQNILILTTASLGFIHTVLGPNHYIPFIAISKAKNWTLSKTLVITALYGIGHVFGSIASGFIGIFSGIAMENLEIIESLRGTIATYLLIVFGLFYMTYGIRKANKLFRWRIFDSWPRQTGRYKHSQRWLDCEILQFVK